MTTPVVHAAKSTQALVSESINLVGKTYLDLDAKGKDLEKDNYEETTISVKDFTVKDKLIRLKGEVTYNDKSIPFDFEGELLKGRKSDNVLIGKLEDRDENFDVIHFSIDNEHENTISLDKTKVKTAQKDSDVLLKLYLLKKGTRDFTVIEELDPTFIDRDIFKDAKKLEKADHIEQFWYSKIIKPEIEIVDEIDDSYEESTDGDFSTMALQSRGITTRHKFTYNIAGDEWTEIFRTKRTIEGPETIRDSAEFVVRFFVTEEETTYEDRYGNEHFVDDETSTKIGRFGDTIVQGWVESDEVIQTVEWDGSYEKPWSWSDPSISIGWSLGKLGASIGVSSSWKNTEQYHALTMKALDNTGGNYTKNAAVIWKEDKHVLSDVGDTFDHVFRVGTYDTSGRKDFNIQISYVIDNPMDEEDSVREEEREISLTYEVE